MCVCVCVCFSRLQRAGRIAGLLDERGKYVVVNEAQLDELRRFVVARGRFTIEELTREANRVLCAPAK